MTLHIYNCETATIRPEMVKRTKGTEVFYGLRLHMNTDQTITFWSKSTDELFNMVDGLMDTIATTPSEQATVPGQHASI